MYNGTPSKPLRPRARSPSFLPPLLSSSPTPCPPATRPDATVFHSIPFYKALSQPSLAFHDERLEPDRSGRQYGTRLTVHAQETVADLHYVANRVLDSDGCFLPRRDVSHNSNLLFELV